MELMTMTQTLSRGLVSNPRGNITPDNSKGIWVLYDHAAGNSIYWGSKATAERLHKTLS